ncbi:unnamed protein product, partial [Effrenium voratum]
MAQAAVTAMARSLQHMAEQAPTDRAEHMRSLVTLLASTPVEPEEVDQVAAELSTDPLGFSAEERDMILQAIRTREAAAPKTRRAAQDYSRLDRFLFASDWQALRNMASARSRAEHMLTRDWEALPADMQRQFVEDIPEPRPPRP